MFATDILEKFRSRLQQLNGETFYVTLDSTKALKAPLGIQTLDACIERLKVARPIPDEDYIEWSSELFEAASSHV